MSSKMERIFDNLTFSEAVLLIQENNTAEDLGLSAGCFYRSFELIENRTLNSVKRCDQGYIYNRNALQYPHSVVETFDWVCENSWLAPLSTSMFMSGMLIGFYVGGWAGDHFGRRPTGLCFCCTQLLVSVMVTVAPSGWVFLLGRLLQGITYAGKMTANFLLVFESTTPNWRPVLCSSWTILQDFFLRAVAACMALCIHNWRWLNAALACLGLLGIMLYFWIPESPRWLFSTKQNEEASQALQKVYLLNNHGHTISDEKFKSVFLAMKKKRPGDGSKNDIEGGFKILVTNLNLFKRLSLGSLVFACHIFSYYGIVLFFGKVREVYYIVGFISALMCIPGPILSCFLYRYFRWRKIPLMVVFILSACITFIGALYSLFAKPDSDIMLSISACLAICLLEAAMDMLYVYIPELFPTRLRSKGIGFASGFARVGSALCSFVNKYDAKLGHGSPLIFFAVSIIMAFLLMFFLPDTDGNDLDDISVCKS